MQWTALRARLMPSVMRAMRESAREHPQNRPTQTIGARVTEIASGAIDRLHQQRRSLTGYFLSPSTAIDREKLFFALVSTA